METHSSVLSWRIPWTEEPGGLQSMGSPRVDHDLATKPHLLDPAIIKTEHSKNKDHGSPLQYFFLENPMDRGAWWATVHGVAQSRT